MWLCFVNVSHLPLSTVLTSSPSSGFSVRMVCVLPVKRGSERLRWPCACGTRFTIWSASSARRVRSTSAWVTATCSSTRTLCASRTSSSGPNSTTTTSLSWVSVTLPCPWTIVRETFLRLCRFLLCTWHPWGLILTQKRGSNATLPPAGDRWWLHQQ